MAATMSAVGLSASSSTARSERLAALVVLWVACLLARWFVGIHIVDDAYITMRYSRHLAALNIISYNPPDAVLGTSSPLWMWLLALGIHAGVSLETSAIVLATAADAVTIGLLVLTSSARPAPFAAALGAAITIAAWPAYVMYAVSGMETSLAVCLTVATVVATVQQRFVVAGVLAGAACLARPDGAWVALLGLVAVYRLAGRATAAAFACGVSVVAMPWIVFAWYRFGSPLPASVVAKASHPEPWTMSLLNLRAYFLQGTDALLTAVSFVGFFCLWRSGDRLWRLWSTWLAGYIAAMTAANAFTHFMWYFVPMLPVYAGGAAAALGTGAARVAPSLTARAMKGAVAPAVLCVAGVIGLGARLPALRTYLEANAAGREALYIDVASRLAHTAPGCTVAATEIGAIGFAYPGRIVDLEGLVTPDAIGRDPVSVLRDSGARWLVTFDSHFARSVARSAEFTALYDRIIVKPVGEHRALEVYERRGPAICGGPSAGRSGRVSDLPENALASHRCTLVRLRRRSPISPGRSPHS